MLKRVLCSFTVPALALCASLAIPGAASAKSSADRFALLPLVAGDTGMPYQVFPSPAERSELGGRLEHQVMQRNGGDAIAPARVEQAVATAGFDQNSAYRACNDAQCARRIGRRLHVDTVGYGSVTRYMAMIWGTEVSLVDVASGKVQGPYSLGYKGDYASLSAGVDELAQSLSQTLVADAAARNRVRTTVATHR